ncbi:MAG: phosphoglycerate dehydrogenase, partial [Planctomycetota bacterium]|nr:phosphoglycerate dehydrogenase [Planctomycetota bacterium]
MISPVALIPQTDAQFVRIFKDAGFEVVYPADSSFTRGRDEDETIRVLQGVSAILAGGEIMTPRVIESLPELRVIARSGVGYDRIDIPAATRHKVAVTITPTANHEAVAEQTLMLMLAVSRNVVHHDRLIRSGTWDAPVSAPLRGRTLGLVGLGRIGRSVVPRAQAFRMKVLAFDPLADPQFAAEHNVELVDFDTLLATSDIVSVHAPMMESTRGLFNRDAFRKMKAGSVLINTSRGGLVVEADLVEALRSGPLSAAGLDVFEIEPIRPDNPLLKLDNVVLTPHKATEETLAQMDMGIEAAQSIVDLHQGRW